jgi:hypothetical protein
LMVGCLMTLAGFGVLAGQGPLILVLGFVIAFHLVSEFCSS